MHNEEIRDEAWFIVRVMVFGIFGMPVSTIGS